MSNLFKFAENILNNLDQSTQSSIHTALEKNKSSGSKSKSGKSTASDINSLSTSQYYDSVDSSAGLRPNSSFSSFTSATSNPKKQVKRTKDDELIDFLNSDANDSKSTDLTNLKTPLMTRSMTESKNTSDNESIGVEDQGGIETQSNKSDTEVESELEQQSDVKLSQLMNENKRLKSEIKNLSGEVKSLLVRMKTTDEDYQRSKRKVDHFQSQISESDKIIRELRAREEDMNESLKGKDSQLAVLRVRFEEADHELKLKKTELDGLRLESDRLLKEHSNSSDIQSQAFETLKDKINECEVSIQREKDAYANAQREYMTIQSRLEAEKQELTSNLRAVEKKLNEEKSKVSDLSSQLKTAKNSSNSLRQELEDYKSKATKILQSKDKLIASLKDGVVSSAVSGGDNDENVNAGETGGRINLKLIEIEELKNERDYLKEELQSKNVAIELLKTEIQDLESQTSQEIDSLRDQVRNMQDSAQDDKLKKDAVETDLRNLRQELNYTQEELYKQKSNLNSRLQEREKEIEKLRNQLTAKTVSTTTEKELEDRLHSLTESLIQKQTLIEALQSEKHSLFLQLERSEKRLQDYENIVSSRKATVLNLNDDDDNASKPTQMFRESPYDHEVTRKVKRAATEIDKFSIRLGVFLKRYPIARVFVIIYMILLHFWVLIVLFTYKPEMHNESFHHPNPALPQPKLN